MTTTKNPRRLWALVGMTNRTLRWEYDGRYLIFNTRERAVRSQLDGEIIARVTVTVDAPKKRKAKKP